jgi:hypothetical protein
MMTTTKTCTLCNHDMELLDEYGVSKCGSGSVYGMAGTKYLCHADDHDCYTLYTIYSVHRLPNPATCVAEYLEEKRIGRHLRETRTTHADICCTRCRSHIKLDAWHDCLGIHDEDRYINEGKLPRSAMKRLKKKYGIHETGELYTKILEKRTK